MNINTVHETCKQLCQAAGINETERCTEEYEQILDLLDKHIIPERYPANMTSESLFYRDAIINKCGYALVAYEWIRPLAAWIGNRKCIEIMAGSGALSFALSQCGVDIIATDDSSWMEAKPEWFSAPWLAVKRIESTAAVRQYAAVRPIIICSWPPYKNASAVNALQEMRCINPEAMMIYIGENEGGATANDLFFQTAYEIRDQDFLNAIRNFKQIACMHDRPYLIK